MKLQTVCILGGSGFVGRHLAEVLVRRGLDVRIPTRRRERAKEHLILLPTVELIQADLHDAQALRRLVTGCDAVINLVGVLHDKRGNGFARNHVELPAKVVAACREAGVPRIVHMSALGADANGPSAYLRSKHQGEEAIRKASAHGIGVTIFRPSVIFGPGDSFLSLFAGLARLAPVLPLGGASARFQPVFVEDVVRVFADSLAMPATFGQAYELCGPREYTLRELVTYVCDVIGVSRPVVPLPAPLAYLQALTLEMLPGSLMTRDNLASMSRPNVCSCPFPAEFGFAPTPLESVAPAYLADTGTRARLDRFRGRAGRA